jgi:hypothetical protein
VGRRVIGGDAPALVSENFAGVDRDLLDRFSSSFAR